jgi:hypothetical protein
MLFDVPRETFLALCRIKSSTLDQRVRVGEAAFALGCERPARVGWYLLLDVVAMILASMLNCFCGLSLKAAVNEVRTHWERWLELVTRVERWQEKYPGGDPYLCIAVAWLALEPGQSERSYRVLFGSHGEIIEDVGGKAYTISFVFVSRVLSALKANADELAGFTLPARLTVAEGEDGHDNWRDEIRAYQERAGARVAKKSLATA